MRPSALQLGKSSAAGELGVRLLQTMVHFDGREPCTYRLDRDVNWLPESLPIGFPHGASGLCFAHQGGELVVLPDGCGFELT
jgi:hypothetical protein